MKQNKKSAALRVALVGMLAATLSCAKLVLSALPNIEVVTLLTALYGYVFGVWGILAAMVFVAVEPLFYSVGPWVITYALYWPLVAFVFWKVGKHGIKNRWILAGIAGILTVWFGVLSTLVDVGLFMGYRNDFFARFGIMYVRGIGFYITQTVCNLILFPLLFIKTAKKLQTVQLKM